MNYPYGMWGPQWAPQTPVVFVPPSSPPNNPTQPLDSWKAIRDHAKREMKREAKMKLKWDEEQKKKKKPEEPKRPMIPVLEGLILMVLISPFIGLPTLKLYQTLFQMWGAALGAK